MKKILDLGCGTGELIRLIEKEEANSKIFGIDYSKKNILTCNLKNNKKNISFKVGVAEKIPFKKNYFDEVYCIEVLEHVKDLEKSLKEIKRVLKNRGKLILSVPLKESEVILKKFNPNYPKQIGHNRFFSKEDLKKILSKNKFIIKGYLAYNSIEHLYWAHAFKKGRFITSQLGVINKKLPFYWRLMVIMFSREIVNLRKSTKNPLNYLIILILHLGYPFGLIMDKILINKKQKVICINKK